MGQVDSSTLSLERGQTYFDENKKNKDDYDLDLNIELQPLFLNTTNRGGATESGYSCYSCTCNCSQCCATVCSSC